MASIVASTQDVIFAHGAANKFVIINPTDGTVDAAITVTVQLQDQYNNIVTTGPDKDKDVTLNADGAATGDGVVNITNGVGTKGISDHVAETVNLSLTDSQETLYNVASTQNVVFGPGAATYLTVTGTATMTAGGNNELTVSAYDQYNNLCSSGDNNYTGAHDLTFSGPTAIGAYTPQVESTDVSIQMVGVIFTNGVTSGSNLTLVAYKAQVTTVDVTDGTIGSSAGGHGLALTVKHADTASLTVTTSTTSPVAGTAINITITAKDAYGNVADGAHSATPYTGSVLLFTDATSPTWYTSVYGFTAANAGTKTLTHAIAFTTVESDVVITARDSATGTITGSQTGINVTAAPGTPTVAITAPVAGAAVSGTYTVRIYHQRRRRLRPPRSPLMAPLMSRLPPTPIPGHTAGTRRSWPMAPIPSRSRIRLAA